MINIKFTLIKSALKFFFKRANVKNMYKQKGECVTFAHYRFVIFTTKGRKCHIRPFDVK